MERSAVAHAPASVARPVSEALAGTLRAAEPASGRSRGLARSMCAYAGADGDASRKRAAPEGRTRPCALRYGGALQRCLEQGPLEPEEVDESDIPCGCAWRVDAARQPSWKGSRNAVDATGGLASWRPGSDGRWRSRNGKSGWVMPERMLGPGSGGRAGSRHGHPTGKGDGVVGTGGQRVRKARVQLTTSCRRLDVVHGCTSANRCDTLGCTVECRNSGLVPLHLS